METRDSGLKARGGAERTEIRKKKSERPRIPDSMTKSRDLLQTTWLRSGGGQNKTVEDACQGLFLPTQILCCQNHEPTPVILGAYRLFHDHPEDDIQRLLTR